MELISAALVRAQRDFGPALKTSTNPHFRSKYANLAACVDAVLEALNRHGIALMQRSLPSEDGVCIETLFIHESGQTINSGPLSLPALKADPQGYGSAMTYARRYSLMAACGIAPEDDDDANQATRKSRAEKTAPVITATDGAADALTEDARYRMDEVALMMVEHHRKGDTHIAADIWYADDTFADNDERTYLWSRLKTESKLRAAIKDDPRAPSNRERKPA